MEDELLLRLESFEFDKPGVALPFSARLARENGWSAAYSRRVISQYLRFVWLAMRAGHPVTPSRAVDEAWHLHLCYTRSYWDRLCGEILGKALHHGPTEGGVAEEIKFIDWYDRTLDSYRRSFGEEPPADIWPPAAERFRPAAVRKVDSASHWVIPKRSLVAGIGGSVLAGGIAVLAGCSPLMARAGSFPVGGLLVCSLFVILAIWIARSAKRGKGGSACGGGCAATGSSRDSQGDISGCGAANGGDSSSGCGSSGCGGGGCGGGD